MQEFERIRSIIINECLLMDIDFEFIEKGCQLAGYEFNQHKKFSYCVYTRCGGYQMPTDNKRPKEQFEKQLCGQVD